MINRDFIDLLRTGQVVWQTFSDKAYKKQNSKLKNGRMVDTVARVIVGTVDDVEAQLEGLSAKGAGIFVQVNEGPRAGVTAVRALFLDLDDAPIEPVIAHVREGVLPAPNAIVQSSAHAGRKKHHVYWLVTGCELTDFRRSQRALASKYGGDPAVCNLDRVMRVPGTKNYKYSMEGISSSCKVLHKNTVPAHEVVDLSAVPSGVGTIASSLISDMACVGGQAYDVDALQAGNRTEAIISEAGRYITVTPGVSAADVMAHLKVYESERLVAGHQPKTEDSWLNEIMPGVLKWIAQRDADAARAADAHKSTVDELAKKDPRSAEAWDASIEDVNISYDDFSSWFVYCSSEGTVYDVRKQANAEPWRLPNFKQWAQPFKIGGSKTTMATKWLNDALHRHTVHISTYLPRRYDESPELKGNRIVFDPMTNTLAYNTYQQPLLKPIAKDKFDAAQAEPLLEHIRYLCNYDVDSYEHFMNWLAFTIQRPEDRIPTVPLIISNYGVGKGWLCECLHRLLGDKNVNNVEMQRFGANNQFNGFMANCKLVVVHETKASRSSVEALKSLITEKSLDINKKYGDMKKQYIFANMLMFSNHDDALPIDEGDRRYWVLRHMLARKSDDYYIKIFDWLDSDGIQHAFRYFLERDISTWKFAANAPMTAAKITMVQSTRHEDEQNLVDAIEHRYGVFELDLVTADCIIDYVQKARGAPFERGERMAFLRRILGGHTRLLMRLHRRGKPHALYAVRNLERYNNFTRAQAKVAVDAALEFQSEQAKLRQVKP